VVFDVIALIFSLLEQYKYYVC